jgi:DHA3 family macrolide efflux protein-like MFS transporter
MSHNNAGIITVLRNRSFLALWLGQLVSYVGDRFAVVAVLVTINQLANAQGLAVVLIAVTITVPQLFALVSGVFVDRFSRKAVMIVSDILRAGLVLLALFVQRPDQLYILYIVAFLSTAVGAFFVPARNASIPNLVPEQQLLTANALIQATDVLSLVAGSSLASLVIAWTGTATGFVTDAATFLLSALFLLFVTLPPRRQAAPLLVRRRSQLHEFWTQFMSGMRYIGRNSHLLQLMAITTVATLGLSATTLLAAVYFDDLLNISAEGLGYLLAMEGLGMALGAWLISSYASWARSRQIISLGMLVLGAGIVVFALAPSFWMVLIGAFVIGICVVSARTTLAAMTQALVPDAQRGRVESAMVTVIGIGTMGAMAMAGLLGDLVGAKAIFVATGIITLLAGAAAAFSLRGAVEELTNGRRH